MISQTAEYALRTITWLASQGNAPRTTKAIAKATRVPAGYLAKVLRSLGRAGLVSSQRGIDGGFKLVKDPEELSVLIIIDAIDPIRRIDSCPLGIESHDKVLCPLHKRIDDALAQLERALAELKISDILAASPGARPFCRIDGAVD